MLTLIPHKNQSAEKRGRIAEPLRWLANSKTAPVETDLTANGLELTNATEEKPVPEWIEIPLGNHDHRAGMQVFDRESAEAIIANFKSLGNRSKGVPFYEGHPDVNPERWPDKSAKGWIKEMELTNSALRLRVKWNAAGNALIANEEYAYFSPTWGCLPVKGRSSAYRPIRLRSVGLVNEPNIGVMPLTNEQTKGKPTMPPWLLKLLGLEPDATEEEAEAALAARLKAVADVTTANESTQGAFATLGAILIESFSNEGDESEDRTDFLKWMHEMLGTDPATGVAGLKAALQDKVEKAGSVERVQKATGIHRAAIQNLEDAHRNLQETLSNEQTAHTSAETELANAREAFAAERKLRAGLVVENLISGGKLRKADSEAKLTELVNAGEGFDALVTTLSNASPVLPTGAAQTANLGKRKETSEHAAEVSILVNERMTEHHEDYRVAFNKVKKARPELFEAMKQPAKA